MMITALTPEGSGSSQYSSAPCISWERSYPWRSNTARKKAFYSSLMDIFDSWKEKTDIGHDIPPDFFEGILLYDVLRSSNKACLEEINRYKDKQEEYANI
jgi:sulfatase maturation enzyme AslB (radical SAM superfamily)